MYKKTNVQMNCISIMITKQTKNILNKGTFVHVPSVVSAIRSNSWVITLLNATLTGV